MTVFWGVALCSLAEIDRCFRGAYCFHHQETKHRWEDNIKIDLEEVGCYDVSWIHLAED
jgi:hypothetical protein